MRGRNFVNLIQKSLLSGVRTRRTGEGDEVVPAHTARQWFPDLLTFSMTRGCLCSAFLPGLCLWMKEDEEDRRMVSLRAWGSDLSEIESWEVVIPGSV